MVFTAIMCLSPFLRVISKFVTRVYNTETILVTYSCIAGGFPLQTKNATEEERSVREVSPYNTPRRFDF
jgi:hypothetical protein